MIRVCCTIGTWQLITLAAALRQRGEDLAAKSGGVTPVFDDYLVVYETRGVPDSFKETLQQMAEVIWPWKRIIWAYDLMTVKRRIGQRRYDFLRQTLQERIGVPADQVNELWVCWLTRPAEKLVFETYPSARIQLFEDGLISYIPVPIAKRFKETEKPVDVRPSLPEKMQDRLESLWPVLRFRRFRRQVDPRHLRRVSSAYLQLTPDAPAPETLAHIPRRFVEYRYLHEALEKVKPILPSSAFADAEQAAAADRILVLGQALSRSRVMSRQEELDVYKDMIDRVLAKGYRILWKEHPRISEPFFAELMEHVRKNHPGAEGRLRQLSMPYAFPVELVADQLGLAGCVAGSSAALFYLPRLHAIPCYTFGDALVPRIKGADAFMNEMMRADVPPLTDLPDLVSEEGRGKALP